jgi:hypothetical protein
MTLHTKWYDFLRFYWQIVKVDNLCHSSIVRLIIDCIELMANTQSEVG